MDEFTMSAFALYRDGRGGDAFAEVAGPSLVACFAECPARLPTGCPAPSPGADERSPKVLSTHTIDRQKARRRRLDKLKAAIDREDPADGIHDADVRALYELAGDEAEFEARGTAGVGRYLGCASEGHPNSSFRQNPAFQVGTSEEVEQWLAVSYVEGWAGRWVIDLEDGTECPWTTLCRFDQDVERSVEPAYTVLAVYREDGQPYVTEVHTRWGPMGAEEIAQRACREDNQESSGDDLLRIVGVIEGVHVVHVGDLDDDRQVASKAVEGRNGT